MIELLVVIAIIAILAAMLLPVLSSAKTKAKIKQAQMEMGQIVTAVQAYESTYNRFPVSTQAQAFATGAGEDITYGVDFLKANYPTLPIPAFYSSFVGGPPNNSETVAILMDMTNYPSTGGATANANHVKNPQRNRFLAAHMISDKVSSGVGTDLVYRDPWGNPYFITYDLNYDEKARDVFYRLTSVSQQSLQQGFNGLFDSQNKPDLFEANTTVLVWSLGPDKKLDPAKPANLGLNKDNVLTWK